MKTGGPEPTWVWAEWRRLRLTRWPGMDSREFYIPGSLLRVGVDATPSDGVGHAGGRPRALLAARQRDAGAACRLRGGLAGGRSDARAVDQDVRYVHAVRSAGGWLGPIEAERYLGGAPAGLLVPHGRGHAVVLGFRPDTRGQPGNTFKLLFNPLYASTMEGEPAKADGGS